MSLTFPRSYSLHRSLWFRSALCVALVGFVTGCPGAAPAPSETPTDTGSGGTPTTGPVEITGRIDSILQDRIESLGSREISIAYSVTGTPDSISGFYVCVTEPCPAESPIGERKIGALFLPASGPNQVFHFSPSVAGVGSFRVGILLSVGDDEIEALSTGVIQVKGLPEPCFVLPCSLLTEDEKSDPDFPKFTACGGHICGQIFGVEKAAVQSVSIRFDAGISDNNVRWRLFFLTESDPSDNTADELGTLIKEGDGHVGDDEFSISDRPIGDYEIGLSSTDSGSTIADTVADGDVDRITTVLGPIIRIIE